MPKTRRTTVGARSVQHKKVKATTGIGRKVLQSHSLLTEDREIITNQEDTKEECLNRTRQRTNIE